MRGRGRTNRRDFAGEEEVTGRPRAGADVLRGWNPRRRTRRGRVVARTRRRSARGPVSASRLREMLGGRTERSSPKGDPSGQIDDEVLPLTGSRGG